MTDPRYRAVLLDFRGILVGFPDDDWWIDRAFAAVGRSPGPHEREQVKLAHPRIRGLPNFAEDEASSTPTSSPSSMGSRQPDPRMFSTALEALSVEPGEALMVGDRASHDGGAADVRIDTLILPAPATFGARGLDVVLGLS